MGNIVKIVKIKDNKNYARDLENGAIILYDKSAITEYEIKKKVALEKERKIASLESEVALLRKAISDLQEIVKNIKG